MSTNEQSAAKPGRGQVESKGARAIRAPRIEGDQFYQVHDNGGRPFTVLIGMNASGNTRVRVFLTRERDNGFECDVEDYRKAPPWDSELLVSWDAVERVWAPRFTDAHVSPSDGLGNSILLQIDRNHDSFSGVRAGSARRPSRAKIRQSGFRYVFIGMSIFQFDTSEPITTFESPIGNNDVPYPVALSSQEAFFLIEQERLPRSMTLAPGPKDPGSDSSVWKIFYNSLYSLTKHFREKEAKPLHGYREIIARRYLRLHYLASITSGSRPKFSRTHATPVPWRVSAWRAHLS